MVRLSVLYRDRNRVELTTQIGGDINRWRWRSSYCRFQENLPTYRRGYLRFRRRRTNEARETCAIAGLPDVVAAVCK